MYTYKQNHSPGQTHSNIYISFLYFIVLSERNELELIYIIETYTYFGGILKRVATKKKEAVSFFSFFFKKNAVGILRHEASKEIKKEATVPPK